MSFMKKIIYNKENLTDKDVDEIVIRVKALIINSKDEILLGHCHKTYQFPGGHLEENENPEEGLKREVKEETGIEIKEINLKPFEKIIYYSSNYRNTGLNRKNEIYYYIVKTNKSVNANNMNLDNWEKGGNYTVKKVPLTDVEQVLRSSIHDNPINSIIVEEMLEVLNEYKNNYR